jgi:hypothetical protein
VIRGNHLNTHARPEAFVDHLDLLQASRDGGSKCAFKLVIFFFLSFTRYTYLEVCK